MKRLLLFFLVALLIGCSNKEKILQLTNDVEDWKKIAHEKDELINNQREEIRKLNERITQLSDIIDFPDVSRNPEAFIKFPDFYLFLGQDVAQPQYYLGSGNKKESRKNNEKYIQETFSDGTRIGYLERFGNVLYIATKNENAISNIGVKINDTKESLLEKASDFTIQNEYIIQIINLILKKSPDPITASMIFLCSPGL